MFICRVHDLSCWLSPGRVGAGSAFRVVTCTALTLSSRFPASAENLVRGLLTPNPTFRLGNLSGGMRDIMNHPFFKELDFNWDDLYLKRVTPPHKPKVSVSVAVPSLR